MYSWGAMGYLAGVLGTHAWFCRRWLVVLFGGLAAEGYGLILDTYSAFSFFNISGNAAIGAVYVAGFFYNLSHVISTIVFLWLIYNLWMSQLTRIKLKYGIGEKTYASPPSAGGLLAKSGLRLGRESRGAKGGGV